MNMKCKRCGKNKLDPQDSQVQAIGYEIENRDWVPICKTCIELLDKFMEGHDVVEDPRSNPPF
jgi:hypothetical protein